MREGGMYPNLLANDTRLQIVWVAGKLSVKNFKPQQTIHMGINPVIIARLIP
jgi:hypothetical protein